MLKIIYLPNIQISPIFCTSVVVAKCGNSTSRCSKWYQVLKGRNRKHGWHFRTAVNTGYWHIFWGPFRFLSKEGSCMAFSGSLAVLHGHTTHLRYWQPRQLSLILFIPSVYYYLLWGLVMNVYTRPSVRWGQKQRWRFLWDEVMILRVKSGDRGVGK